MILDKTKGDITSYCKLEMDNDSNDYYFIRSEVYSYKRHNEKINELLNRWEKLCDNEKGLYIKRNYLFFTECNIKFYAKISVFTSEWEHINDIVSELSNYAQNVAYIFGELD